MVTQQFQTRLHQAANLLDPVINLDPNQPSSLSSYLELADHVTTIASHLQPTDPSRAAIWLEHLGRAQSLSSMHPLAIGNFERALQARYSSGSPETQQIADILIELGYSYGSTGEYERGFSRLQSALLLVESHPDADTDTDTELYVKALSTLGLNRRSVGEFASAERYLRLALSTSLEAFGQRHAATAITYNRIGLLCWSQGNLNEAVTFLSKAIDSWSRDSKHAHNARIALNNLALTQKQLGNFSEAEQSAKASLSIKQQQFGPGHHRNAITLVHLADIQRELGNLSLALASIDEALHMRLKQPEPTPEGVARLLSSLSRIQIAAERQDLAEQALTISVDIYRGIKRPHVGIDAMRQLAILYGELGNLAESRNLFIEATKDATSSNSYNGFRVGQILIHHANTERLLGEFKTAHDLLDRGEALVGSAAGEEHYEVGSAYFYRGLLAEDEGQLELAETHLRRALAIEEAVYGEDGYQLIEILQALGRIQGELGKTDSVAHQRRAERLDAAMERPVFEPLPASLLAMAEDICNNQDLEPSEESESFDI